MTEKGFKYSVLLKTWCLIIDWASILFLSFVVSLCQFTFRVMNKNKLECVHLKSVSMIRQETETCLVAYLASTCLWKSGFHSCFLVSDFVPSAHCLNRHLWISWLAASLECLLSILSASFVALEIYKYCRGFHFLFLSYLLAVLFLPRSSLSIFSFFHRYLREEGTDIFFSSRGIIGMGFFFTLDQRNRGNCNWAGNKTPLKSEAPPILPIFLITYSKS